MQKFRFVLLLASQLKTHTFIVVDERTNRIIERLDYLKFDFAERNLVPMPIVAQLQRPLIHRVLLPTFIMLYARIVYHRKQLQTYNFDGIVMCVCVCICIASVHINLSYLSSKLPISFTISTPLEVIYYLCRLF